jgi:hypothetical protein
MTLALVPPPPPPTPAQQETAIRAEMLRGLGWRVTVASPPWSEVVFLGRPREVELPPVPAGVIERLKGLKKEWFAPDEIGLAALAAAEKLAASMPRGSVPRSVGAAMELPPARDAMQAWQRTATITATGPDVAPLLVSGGFLTAPDVAYFEATYPAGLGDQRLAATEANGIAVGAAGRADEPIAYPRWLDGQMTTFMGEADDAAPAASALASDDAQKKAAAQAPQGAGVGGGGTSKIAEQFRPKPSPEST